MCGTEARVIRNDEPLRNIDREFSRTRLARLTYHDALAIFAGLWREAEALGAHIDDWRSDIEPDLAVARAVNGLPPIA